MGTVLGVIAAVLIGVGAASGVSVSVAVTSSPDAAADIKTAGIPDVFSAAVNYGSR